MFVASNVAESGHRRPITFYRVRGVRIALQSMGQMLVKERLQEKLRCSSKRN